MRWLGVIAVVLLLIGCAVNKPFAVSKDWMKLDEPPSDAAAILASSNEKNFVNVKGSWSYRSTWFKRSSDDYLIYFQYQATDDACGDMGFEFKKADGKWNQVGLGGGAICSEGRY